MTATPSSDIRALAFTCCVEPMLLLDAEGRIHELNPAAERLLGRPSAEVRGGRLDDVLEPAAAVARLVQEAFADHTGRVLPEDAALHRGDGGVILLDGSVSPLSGAAGACAGALVVLRDVTEQRRAARAVRESEARLREAIDTLDAGFVLYGKDERLLHYNPKYAQMYPEAAPTMEVGKPYEAILRAGYRNATYLHASITEDEWVMQRLANHRRAAGTTLQRLGDRWIRIDDRRTSDGSVISLRTDLTALKEAEIALERERRLNRRVIDADPNTIVVNDKDGRVLLANQAAAEFCGTTVDGFQGKLLGEIFPHLDETDQLHGIDRQVLESMQPASMVHRFPAQEGDARWFNLTKVPLMTPDGIACVLSIGVDITERKTHEELMAATIVELDQQRREIADKLAVIERQQAIIRALSTPILQVAEGALAVPLIGALDDARAADITSKLLEEIVHTGAHYAIIDVTGVESVDAAMAGLLVRMVSTIQLLGAQGILTGIQPAVAQAISAIGVDLRGVTTRAHLRAGIEACIRALSRGRARAPASRSASSRRRATPS